jgi:enoyl-CoA hydratase/carnithine racemase
VFTVEQEGAVATLRYVNPPHGFLTARALAQLRTALRALERDPAVRVIVIAGEPSRFIAHSELDEIERMLALAARMPRWLAPLVRALVWLFHRAPRLADLTLRGDPVRAALLNVWIAFSAVQRSSKVTVAAIDGPCVGGGLELSLACDFRLASDVDAHPLGCPEVLLGLLPGFGGTQRLARLIGAPRALELLVEGRLVTPREAERLGVVSRLLPRDRFDEEVRQFAARLARRPSTAVAAIKRALRAAEPPLRLHAELREVLRLAGTDELRAGVARYRAALARTRDLDALAAAMD